MIQASHVSTGTTNNALVINPSGGNVGVGTTAPAAKVHAMGSVYVHNNTINSAGGFMKSYLIPGVVGGLSLGALSGGIGGAELPAIYCNDSSNVGIGTTTPGYPLSVGSTYGVMTSATFTLAGTSSVNTGYTLPAGGLYQVTVTSNSANGPGAGNSHWWWFGLVNFNNASFIGFPITINNNNATVSVATNGQVTVATPGGSGSFSWIISAVRLC